MATLTSATRGWVGALVAGVLLALGAGLVVRDARLGSGSSAMERAAAVSRLSVPDMRRIMGLMDRCERTHRVSEADWNELSRDYKQRANHALAMYAFMSVAFIEDSAHRVEREQMAREQLSSPERYARFYAAQMLRNLRTPDWRDVCRRVAIGQNAAKQQCMQGWLQEDGQ